jgi:hypothetical protein
MYELNLDNGEVGHVWKQNVEAELTPTSQDAPDPIGIEASLHYRLAKAIKNLKVAHDEVESAHAALDRHISSRQRGSEYSRR